MRGGWGRAAALWLLALAACSGRADDHFEAPAGESGAPPDVTATGSSTPSPAGASTGEWTSVGGDPQLTRFSSLDEIDRESVASLRVAWTFSTGIPAGHEAAPLVIGGRMYLVTPFPNRVYALDLAREGAPVAWTYEPPYVLAAKGVACCDIVNRGLAYADGRLFYATLDNATLYQYFLSLVWVPVYVLVYVIPRT